MTITAEGLRVFSWIGVPLLVVVLSLFQRHGPGYVQAARLSALAIVAPFGFYLGCLAFFGGDVNATLAFASAIRSGIILALVQMVFLAWAIGLAARVTLGKPGTLVDIWFRDRLPYASEIEHSLVTIKRAEHHDLIGPLTIAWMDEDITMRRAMELAYARNDPDGGVARPAFRLRVIATLLRRLAGGKRRRRRGGIPDGRDDG